MSEIEYISNTFINADGTDEFMNNNNTVSVGLPYNATAHYVQIEKTDVTTDSLSVEFNIESDELASLSGGIIGVSVYDGYSIIKNQAISTGLNTLELSGLKEKTEYQIIAYIFADLHDSQGVKAHIIGVHTVETKSAVEYLEIEAGYSSNFDDPFTPEDEGESGITINVSVGLGSESA